jgi:hypothetical protein
MNAAVTAVTTKAKAEPVLLYTILGLIFSVAQVAALPVAPWIHVVVIIAAQMGAAWVARRKVIPATPSP